MEFNKLFTDFDLNVENVFDTITADGTKGSQLCTYYVSLLWGPRGKNNSLAMLNGRVAGQGGQFHQIITHPMTDSDGEITVVLGRFHQATRIELDFTVYALEDIPACALFIVNATKNIRKKIAPPEPKRTLARGEAWHGNIIITLP